MPNVAHALVRTMADVGVDRIFLNPGTDTAPIQEAVAELDGPRVVLCLHEEVALAAAHAYFAATGRPQVVMVHVDVGTQNLGSMMHNADRANAGVVVIAGRTPQTAYGELPGGRDTGVHWMQDVPDQAGVVRPYVKWAADLTEPATTTRLLARALQVAGSAPTGPVYLTVPREVLMAAGPDPFDASRFGPSVAPAPDPTALARAADVLAGSARPVIVTSRIGQRTTAVAELVKLVDTLGASVVETRERVNFPSGHPAYQRETADAAAALRSADAVLVVDCPIPWIPASVTPPDDATVISMELDPVWTAMPHWSYPVDLPIQCDPEAGVRELRKALQDRKIEPRGWRA
ncbi:MAG TPA: thiamine pyrophosphate-binding protein, partial [Pseudonocardiaceae bacterium]|nr:thiamine pyrophosphate-binding protein [Pseudonocardiaceae bacterium]